jgi:hypothetical protein
MTPRASVLAQDVGGVEVVVVDETWNLGGQFREDRIARGSMCVTEAWSLRSGGLDGAGLSGHSLSLDGVTTATVALEGSRRQRRGQIYVALAAVAWSTAGVSSASSRSTRQHRFSAERRSRAWRCWPMSRSSTAARSQSCVCANARSGRPSQRSGIGASEERPTGLMSRHTARKPVVAIAQARRSQPRRRPAP